MSNFNILRTPNFSWNWISKTKFWFWEWFEAYKRPTIQHGDRLWIRLCCASGMSLFYTDSWGVSRRFKLLGENQAYCRTTWNHQNSTSSGKKNISNFPNKNHFNSAKKIQPKFSKNLFLHCKQILNIWNSISSSFF